MSDAELIERYRGNYDLPAEVSISAEQIRHHLAFEQDLTRQLLESSPETRWDVFERCYDQLYSELPWLAGSSGQTDFRPWYTLLGRPPKRVYEVGSGAGNLARYLAARGFEVTATDVSRERGGAREDDAGVTWEVTDGVHLDEFAPAGSFDVVISDQVIEHLHPDDAPLHFRAAHALLRPGGRYVFKTPHALTGPHDVSRVFGLSRPVGMHLREYDCDTMRSLLEKAGFARAGAVFAIPGTRIAFSSSLYLAGLVRLERALARLGPARARRVAHALRGPLRPRVFLVATR